MDGCSLKMADQPSKSVKTVRKRVDKYKSLRKRKRKGFCGAKSDVNSGVTGSSTADDENIDLAIEPVGVTEEVVVDEAVPETTQGSNDIPLEGENASCSVTNDTSVMEKKQGVDVQVTPRKLTRKRKHDSSILSPDSVTPATGYKIVDSVILQNILNLISICPYCKVCGKLELKQDNGKRHGLCEVLVLLCKACHKVVNTFKTSRTIPDKRSSKSKVIDVNLRSVIATTSAGGGLTTLRRICSDMNFTPPITENAYNRYIRQVEETAIVNCKRSMVDAAHKLRTFMINGEDDGRVVDVTVSVDAAWQKRYGYNSLLGMVFLISIDTGQVLDYVVKSKSCHQCKSHKNSSLAWKQNHTSVCCMNHEGSSGSMETAGAIEMFSRSMDLYNIRYTTYVGDGDSSAFGKVQEMLEKKYGDQYIIQKEDCIGHIQKRMGTALRKYKNNHRGTRLSDGKGVGGAGRLTDAIVDRIQTYYGYAIRNNKGDVTAMRNAIWAIFQHVIRGPEKETLHQQHAYCPISDDTWCKYQKDKKLGSNSYNDKKCLPFIFRGELKPIFDRLSSDDILLSCQRGLTQNQNEALNGVVWSRCPKRLYCGAHRFTISVCDGITQFNDGATGRYKLYKALNFDTFENSLKGLQRDQHTRVRRAAQKISSRYKKRRQVLRQLRKTKTDDKSYIAGGFGKSSVPDIDFTSEPVVNVKKKKDKKVEKKVEILFIDDNDVQNFYMCEKVKQIQPQE